MLDKLVAAQVQTSQQLWDHFTQAVRQTQIRAAVVEGNSRVKPVICIPKMTMDDNPETFLHTFKHSAGAVDWPEEQ